VFQVPFRLNCYNILTLSGLKCQIEGDFDWQTGKGHGSQGYQPSDRKLILEYPVYQEKVLTFHTCPGGRLILFHDLLEGDKEPQLGQPISRPWYEPEVPQIQRSATHWFTALETMGTVLLTSLPDADVYYRNSYNTQIYFTVFTNFIWNNYWKN